MNVLTIYLPWGKLPVASNLRIVKTAVVVRNVRIQRRVLWYFAGTCMPGPSISTTLPRSILIRYVPVLQKEIVRESRVFG